MDRQIVSCTQNNRSSRVHVNLSQSSLYFINKMTETHVTPAGRNISRGKAIDVLVEFYKKYNSTKKVDINEISADIAEKTADILIKKYNLIQK